MRVTSKKPDRREIGFTRSIGAQTKKPKTATPEMKEPKRKTKSILGQSGKHTRKG